VDRLRTRRTAVVDRLRTRPAVVVRLRTTPAVVDRLRTRGTAVVDRLRIRTAVVDRLRTRPAVVGRLRTRPAVVDRLFSCCRWPTVAVAVATNDGKREACLGFGNQLFSIQGQKFNRKLILR